jgi:hypothetical protein
MTKIIDPFVSTICTILVAPVTENEKYVGSENIFQIVLLSSQSKLPLNNETMTAGNENHLISFGKNVQRRQIKKA